ncbi:MAG: DNA-binding protein [Thermodesulfovibrionales bacterium]
MKKYFAAMTIVFVFGLLAVTDSYAQRGMKWRGSGGWGPGSQYSRIYDIKTVETVKGEVVSIDKMTPIRGMHYGVHLTVQISNKTISVHLGPGWYIENQDVKIEPKDKIEIRGSRVTFEGNPVIIAAEVKKGNDSLKLRDENGFPVWAGWRR